MKGERASLPAVDLTLSPEHELLRRTLRDFLAKEVEPVIEEHEKARKFPNEIVQKLGDMGMLGIPFPEEEGGADHRCCQLAVARFERRDHSIGVGERGQPGRDRDHDRH